jgi:large subunit ribosomal protein L10
MALTKERKKEIIDSLEQKCNDQKVMIFAGFKGSKNKDLLELRRELKSNDSCLMVAKKTLMKIAFSKNKFNLDYDKLDGEIAVVFGFQDEVIPAKTIFNFSKKNKTINIIGGVLDGEFKESADIIELAKLPSKQEILAKLVGTIQAPVSGFANVLQGNIKGLVYLLSNIKK